MSDDVKKCLILLAKCTNGKEHELAGIVQSVIENSRLAKLQSSLTKYSFLSLHALELQGQIEMFQNSAVNFTQALERWQAAEVLADKFDQMNAVEFVPGANYHIVSNNNYTSLLQGACEYLGSNLYEAIRFGNIERLKLLVLPPMDNINKVVDFTNSILESRRYTQDEKNITNLTRENVWAFFKAHTIKEVTLNMITPDAKLALENRQVHLLFPGRLYCISEHNYDLVLKQYNKRRAIKKIFNPSIICVYAIYSIVLWAPVKLLLDNWGELPAIEIIGYLLVGVGFLYLAYPRPYRH